MFKLSNAFILIFVTLLTSGQAFSANSAKVDPTRPFERKGSATTTPLGKSMVLESIIHSEGINTVVINGQVLKMFDYIGEYQLTMVNEQSVVLRSNTQRIELNIFKNNLVKMKIAK